MSKARLTLQSATWGIAGFLDAGHTLLISDRTASELRIYAYAVTRAGWKELEADVRTWAAFGNRPVIAYVGTDHALTDPLALDDMQAAGLSVRLMRRYTGVFHPKALWWVIGDGGHLLTGSNNLTLDGLKRNIEFATLTRFARSDPDLEQWHANVHGASDSLSAVLLDSYAAERARFARRRSRSGVPATFTWTKRSSGGTPPTGTVPTLAGAAAGDLILEIMPRETGSGGTQVQIPLRAATVFFGLGAAMGSTQRVRLRNIATHDDRQLTITRFGNNTTRVVIHELDYRDRPCVLLFRRTPSGVVEFEIVSESVDPTRYRSLIRRARLQTRAGSRRWTILTP